MSFEEEFPSLKGKVIIADGANEIGGDMSMPAVYTSYIERFCLDKAKVKKAIDNLAKKCMYDSFYKEPPAWWFRLKKELGL